MRKLRQGMDSLLKTSRLMCSVLRLQQVSADNGVDDNGDGDDKEEEKDNEEKSFLVNI